MAVIELLEGTITVEMRSSLGGLGKQTVQAREEVTAELREEFAPP